MKLICRSLSGRLPKELSLRSAVVRPLARTAAQGPTRVFNMLRRQGIAALGRMSVASGSVSTQSGVRRFRRPFGRLSNAPLHAPLDPLPEDGGAGPQAPPSAFSTASQSRLRGFAPLRMPRFGVTKRSRQKAAQIEEEKIHSLAAWLQDAPEVPQESPEPPPAHPIPEPIQEGEEEAQTPKLAAASLDSSIHSIRRGEPRGGIPYTRFLGTAASITPSTRPPRRTVSALPAGHMSPSSPSGPPPLPLAPPRPGSAPAATVATHSPSSPSEPLRAGPSELSEIQPARPERSRGEPPHESPAQVGAASEIQPRKTEATPIASPRVAFRTAADAESGGASGRPRDQPAIAGGLSPVRVPRRAEITSTPAAAPPQLPDVTSQYDAARARRVVAPTSDGHPSPCVASGTASPTLGGSPPPWPDAMGRPTGPTTRGTPAEGAGGSASPGVRTPPSGTRQAPSEPGSPSGVIDGVGSPRARVSAPDALPSSAGTRLEVPSTPFSEAASTRLTSGGETPGSTPSAPPSGRRSGRISGKIPGLMRSSGGGPPRWSISRRASTHSLPHVPSEPHLTDDQLLLRNALRGWREAATAQHLARLAEFERLEKEGAAGCAQVHLSLQCLCV